MNQVLNNEIERLNKILDSAGIDFPSIKGARDRDLQRAQRKTGIKLTEDLTSFYKIMDGSDRNLIFIVHTDEITPVEFNSLEQALKSWSFLDPKPAQYVERINQQYQGYEQSPPRDKRIQPSMWANLGWFPFGDFNGGSTKVYLDMNPTNAGEAGQIIAYQHDPDAIYFVAPNFLTFLIKSNDLLEKFSEELYI